MPSAGAVLDRAARRLRESGSASPRLDAELLLGCATSWTREMLLAHPERVVGERQVATFDGLVERRVAAEPMAYLLGEREFYGRMFHVDRRALIPRPETELLVELGMAAVDRWRARGVEPNVIEIGTGAGGVAISLALERRVQVVATDISPEALALAAENAALHRVSESAAPLHAVSHSVRFVQTDLLRDVSGPLHVLLANLPYVPTNRSLPADVRDYEPHVALFGGERGTELIERLLVEARPLLCQGAEVCVELDEQEQAAPVAQLARSLYAGKVEICQDAGGYDRVVRVVVG